MNIILQGLNSLRLVLQGLWALPTFETATLSDFCEMADASLWLGHYSAAGGLATPLRRVKDYETQHVGTVGNREVRKLTYVTLEPAVASPSCRGVLSLHPAGYALVEADAGNVQMWRYASGTWTVAAETAPETTLSGGSGYLPEGWSGTGGGGTATVLPVSPLTYRLEVIGGEVYALPKVATHAGLVLRGSALPTIDWTDAFLLPALREYRLGIPSTSTVTYYRQQAAWAGRWYGETVDHDLQQNGAAWWVDLGSGSYKFDTLAVSDGARLLAATLDFDSFALWHSDARDPMVATANAGLWICRDGLSVRRGSLDCLPLSGRATSGRVWLLGTDAAGAFAHLARGTTGSADYTVVDTGRWLTAPTPTALYLLGTPVPADGVTVVGSEDGDDDGWYWPPPDVPPVNDRPVYIKDPPSDDPDVCDPGRWIVWVPDDPEVPEGPGHWVIIDVPPLLVDGELWYPACSENGRPRWRDPGGGGEIVWLPDDPNDPDGPGHWVIRPIGGGPPSYVDGGGTLPLGPWTDPVGGPGPVVGIGPIGPPLEIDGTGDAPWTWPVRKPTPPAAGEGVNWRSHTDADRPATMVRVASNVSLADEANFRAVVGIVDPTGGPDWADYQAVEWGENVVLPEAAETVWFGIIGATALDVPPATLVTVRGAGV